MSAGLEASTVTPGSTPPVSSVITVGRDGRTGEALRRVEAWTGLAYRLEEGSDGEFAKPYLAN